MKIMRRTHVFAFAVASLLASTSLSAQVVVLDEGAFRLHVNGQPVGTETFSIRRAGLGNEAELIAVSQVQYDDGSVIMRPTLNTDASFRPIRYENQVSGTRESTVVLALAGRRYTATVVSAQGEAASEFRAAPRTLILVPRVATLYYFLSPFLSEIGSEISGIEPEDGGRPALVLTSVAPAQLTIGGQSVAMRLATLQDGSATRRIWFDEQGRVMRVEVPAQNFVAERIQN